MAKKSKMPDVEEARRATYYTSVVLNKGRNNDYQLVFASQVYGTFFGIYAKFDITEKDNGSVKLNSVNFRIINYKGLINMGINEIEITYKPNQVVKLKIKFHLKGLMLPLQDKLYDCNKMNIILKSGDEMVASRILDKFINTRDEIFENGAFDDEFYFRDGLYPIEAPSAKLEDKIKREYPEEPKRPLGTRCPKTLIRIVTGE